MRYCLLIVALLAVTFCSAQRLTMDKVPAAAAQAFKIKYPNGSQAGWIKASATTYEVQFFNGKKRQAAYFDDTGKWIETHSEAGYNQLPGKVRNVFERDFENYIVQEVYEIETPDKGFNYEVTAFKGKQSFIAVFSAKGELVKMEENTSVE